MGRGIVEPVDDFRDSNPPSSAALLDALADDFAKNGYDRKRVIRTILNSRTYQLSSRKNEFNCQRREVLLARHHAAVVGRAIARRDLPGDERVGEICRAAGRHAGHAVAQPGRRQRLPQGLRPAGPRDGLPVRAFDRFEPVASLADDQRSAGTLQGPRRQESPADAGRGRQDRTRRSSASCIWPPCAASRASRRWRPRPSTSPMPAIACAGWKTCAGPCSTPMSSCSSTKASISGCRELFREHRPCRSAGIVCFALVAFVFAAAVTRGGRRPMRR